MSINLHKFKYGLHRFISNIEINLDLNLEWTADQLQDSFFELLHIELADNDIYETENQMTVLHTFSFFIDPY